MSQVHTSILCKDYGVGATLSCARVNNFVSCEIFSELWRNAFFFTEHHHIAWNKGIKKKKKKKNLQLVLF